MTKKADIGSKRLISLALQAWAQWVTHKPDVHFQEMFNSEFQWLAREGDVLLRAWAPDSGEFLIANEIQLRYSPEMLRRMRLYASLAEEKFSCRVSSIGRNLARARGNSNTIQLKIGRS